MAGHVIHVAVVVLGEPVVQPGFIVGEVDRGNPQLLKAEFQCPGADLPD